MGCCANDDDDLFFTASLLYMFRVLSEPIIRSIIKTVDRITGTSHVSVWCGLNPLKDVEGRESTSLCHGQIGYLTYGYIIK
jgi:hypothetical protein